MALELPDENARRLIVAVMARAIKDARSSAVSIPEQREAAAAREFLASKRAAELTTMALPDLADRLSSDEICKRLLTTVDD